MIRKIAVSAALFGAVWALSACNSSTNPGPTPTLGPTCQLPTGVQTALVYPAPGSTVTASSITEIVIGSTTALDPTRFQPVISDAINPPPFYFYPGAPGPPFLQTATPPFPSPNQAPAFPSPQYQSVALQTQFGAPQTVTVYINDTKSSNNCTPFQIGSFATQ